MPIDKKDLDAASLKQTEKALIDLEQAERRLTAAGVEASNVNIRQLNSMKALVGETDAAKKAMVGYLQSLIDVAIKTGDNLNMVAKWEQAQKSLNASIEQSVNHADLLTEKIRGVMGISSAWKKDIVGIMAHAAAGGKKISDVFKEMSEGKDKDKQKAESWASMTMKATEAVNAGFYGILSQTMKLGTAVDNASVSFVRLTGGSKKFAAEIPQLESKFYKLGLSAEDAAGVMGSLYNSMSGFTRLGAGAQKAVRETTAVLETLGIDAATSAKNMEILNRSMGFTGQQAANISQQLFGLAQRLNVSTTQMMEDFTRIGPQLTVHGRSAVNVFVRLEAAAKASGIQVDRLLSLSSKFDTFRGAAESVGHLNAVLGGPYLSVMKMVQQTDPTKRMQMLSDATRQAGMSFDQMSYYQRKAIAEAAGLQDVNELALVMKGRFDLVAGSVHKNANEIEKLAEENKRYKTIQQELQQVMRSLAAPVTSVLKGLRWILDVMQRNTGVVKLFASAIMGLKAAMVALKFAAFAAQAGMQGLGASAAAAAGPIGILVGIISAVGFAMFTEQHSPPLFGKNSGMAMAASQTAQFGSSIGYAAKQASAMSGPIKKLATDINALPDSKMLRIEKVFTAEEGVLTASKGANITAHTVRLLGAAAGGSAAGRPIQNHMDVTVEMDGKVVGHQVARQLSDKRNA
tara:strand:+ start:1201 stop:3261 length:2061 start_codon:yes stop_codon:yes gene_type:complete